MNRDQLLKSIDLLTAISQGKMLQYCQQPGGEWIDLTGVNPRQVLDNSHLYRVKPEPKYRPWQLHEIPVGAVARRSHKSLNQTPQVIVGADYLKVSIQEEQPPCAIMPFECKEYTVVRNLLKNWEWKWAHEPDLSWRVCGVPE